MMNGKQKIDNSNTDDDCSDVKKAKIDDIVAGNISSTSTEGKENIIKVYPKRKRTPSVKAFEGLVQESVKQKDDTTKGQKKSENDPTKPLLGTVTPGSSKEPQGTTEKVTLNVEATERVPLIPKSTIKKVPAKTKDTVKSKNEVQSAAEKVPAKLKDNDESKNKAQSTTKKVHAKPKDVAKPKNKSQEDNKRKRCMPKTVNTRLEQMGIHAGSVSFCVKAAMCKGFISITGDPSDLEQVIYEGNDSDGHTYKVLLKDVLYQPDHGGDYEDGSESATALCACCPPDDYPGRSYVTRLCQGNPELDCGKFHNHCRECKKGFGVCINDYRMAHCGKCNLHWFQGLSGFPCDNCKRKRRQSRGFAGIFMDSDSGEDENPGCSVS